MASVGTALRELRGAQKSAKGVSLYSRFVNRPAGRYLAAGSYALGLTPNQVTLISAAFSFAAVAAVALAAPSWGLGVVVWAALAVGFAFDSADGQLARLRGGGSASGEWLDHVVDCAKLTALHTCVLIAFYRFPDAYGTGGGAAAGDGWLLVPLGFQFAAVVTFFGGLLTEKLKPKPAPGSPAAAPSTLRAVALLPVDYGVFCLVFLLLGGGELFRWAYAGLGVVAVLFLLAFLTKWFRELSAVPR
ncbi:MULTISPECIES: CDP-alcohol phosphatidyltransferase family protein [unclassified Streptomyces]|uniref:CDP-alcohol phosphatidyltransferase family protein n=1 Tax=unclassified Streptomyces TaxID=2593676 RepID=UPI001BE98DB5|nr:MULTISPECIES: CDP-alcohol phosphatidyltransferase family protein [unclassified Streptomyces]MBT2403961.1 CDP-alcohol phosphatidyltransferase family protein [Streptomyces sp. ISL-21]MBT2457472.1 CDP-alcohol phosphatidyltransferase family protein [Streptomyces sp. ISL-86]MBT2608384.1 CDP-alcohol phosphatidyltransferase family protein [Streptomyces sp. ISL-87]